MFSLVLQQDLLIAASLNASKFLHIGLGVVELGILFKSKGDWNKTTNFLNRNKSIDNTRILAKYGKKGVLALSSATPKDTGLTAASWDYEIIKTNDGVKLVWTNSNLAEPGMPIAILIQYGHATKRGSYVQGVDYINPALKPIFEEMAQELWNEVVK